MSKNSKKIMGAILSVLFASLIMLLYLGGAIYLFITEGYPLIEYMIVNIIFGIPLIILYINLVMRIKEIKSGEEDEASKY